MRGFFKGTPHCLRALLAAERHEPSLNILDLGMPNMDGWSLRQALGRASDLAFISIVIATKDRRAYVGKNCVCRQNTAVPCKPFELDQLVAVIRDAVDEERL